MADFAPQFRLTHAQEVSKEDITEAKITFQKLCEDYLGLERLMDAPMPHPPYPEPYEREGLNPQTLGEEIAMLERSRLGLGLGPIPNLREVLESDVGLRVFVTPIKEFKIAGMFVFTDPLGGCIWINGSHPSTRQKWSLAHEYAHFLTDRFKQEITVLIEYEKKPPGEKLADGFTANFLMPSAGLRQRFRRIVQSRENFTVADLCLLADQYGVSAEAMTRRLESLGDIQKGTWEKLSPHHLGGKNVRDSLGLQAKSAERWRFPDRYRMLAIQAHVEEKISESELMRLLYCTRVEAREAVAELTQTLEISETGEPYQLEFDFGEVLHSNSAGKR
jgi:Zn-dependent peptidase ImmA (M78 family)